MAPMTPDDANNAVSLSYSTDEVDEPVLTVIEAVATVKGLDETALEPLNHAVDVDALRAIFGTDNEDAGGSTVGDDLAEVTVTFDYEGCEVTVEQNRVHVSRMA